MRLSNSLVSLLVFACATAEWCAEVGSQPPSVVREQRTDEKPGEPLRRDAIELEKVSRPGLQNVLRISDRLYSGSEPHGEEGFASLASLGVSTVVSVDGARPDLEMARKHGLRYVHIPIGYDGVSKQARLSLTRLMRETQGLIYVHCHHGRHRGPAAAAVACMAAGKATPQEALEILRLAGTGAEYVGLWRDVEHYSPPGNDETLPELREVAEVDSIAAAMAQLDRHFDDLKLCHQAAWGVPPAHPDLVAAQQALLVREGFRESVRHLTDQHDQQLRQWLTESERVARSLEDALKAGQTAIANERFGTLQKSCKQCHIKYRD